MPDNHDDESDISALMTLALDDPEGAFLFIQRLSLEDTQAMLHSLAAILGYLARHPHASIFQAVTFTSQQIDALAKDAG